MSGFPGQTLLEADGAESAARGLKRRHARGRAATPKAARASASADGAAAAPARSRSRLAAAVATAGLYNGRAAERPQDAGEGPTVLSWDAFRARLKAFVVRWMDLEEPLPAHLLLST